MKCLLVIVAVVCVAFTEVKADYEKMRQVMQDCMKEFNVDEAAVKSGNVDKCFYRCAKQKMGMMDANGEFTIDAFKAANPNPPPHMIEDLTACAATSKKADSCDTAKAVADCMKAKHPQPPNN